MKGALLLIVLLSAVVCVLSSSHSEAPGTLSIPQADVTDVYAFMSYETGRTDYITVAALFQPLMNPFAGPNYYQFSNSHFYDILVDNRGSGRPKFTFRFEFANEFLATPLAVPAFGSTVGNTEIPLKFIGPIDVTSTANLNFQETFTATVVKRFSNKAILQASGLATFTKAFDNVGAKTFADYNAYANSLIYDVVFPTSLKCDSVAHSAGRIFVGPRKDPFYIYLGGVFDLVNFVPIVGAPGAIPQNAKKFNDIQHANVHAIVMEIHKSCLLIDATASSLGFWARTYDKVAGHQVSRMGNPLINELFIGLPDKDHWNARMPHQDRIFNNYLLFPSFPKILEVLFLSFVQTNIDSSILFLEPHLPGGRGDLLTLFHKGVPGVTQLPLLSILPPTTFCDMLRLNTTIAPIPYASQNSLGLAAGDNAGFPNGRRLKDDVVDIYLRASLGLLLDPSLFGGLFGLTTASATAAVAPVYNVPLIDGVPPTDSDYIDVFPYMANPLPGSPAA